jgi:hypothetical protein
VIRFKIKIVSKRNSLRASKLLNQLSQNFETEAMMNKEIEEFTIKNDEQREKSLQELRQSFEDEIKNVDGTYICILKFL